MAILTSVLRQLQQERNRRKSQIENLNLALSALNGTSNNRARTGRIPAAGRARMAAARRARSPRVKGNKVVSIAAHKALTMSPAGRRRIAAAQKARWAKWRNAQEKG